MMEKPAIPEWYNNFSLIKPEQKPSQHIFYYNTKYTNISYHDIILDNKRYKLVIDLESDWDNEIECLYPIVTITLHDTEDPEFKKCEKDYLERLEEYEQKLKEYNSISEKIKEYDKYLLDKNLEEDRYKLYLSLKAKFEGKSNG